MSPSSQPATSASTSSPGSARSDSARELPGIRAARLEQPASALLVKEIAAPVLPPDGVRIRVLAAQVLPFSHAVLAGDFPFPLPTPYTFGSSAVGIVEEVASGITGLTEGALVFCDPYLPGDQPDGIRTPMIIGWFALSDAAAELQSRWRDGAFAEQAVYPALCCTPLQSLETTRVEQLACLNYLNIAYGGLLRGGLRPGESVIVTGATGNLGAGAVLAALAMGAGEVIAAGRNGQVLQDLVHVDPDRIRAVELSGDATADAAGFSDALQLKGSLGADLALDCVGLTDRPEHLSVAVAALNRGGRLVCIGGVNAPIPLDYQTVLGMELTVCGSFMGPRTGPAELASLARAGLLKLDALRPQTFLLDQINAAIDAARNNRGLDFTVLSIDQ